MIRREHVLEAVGRCSDLGRNPAEPRSRVSPPAPSPIRRAPITIIVPFAAGGATDTLTRFLAEQIRPVLGQPIVIENVAGAAGTIGVGRAVRSPADGYTLSIGTSTTHMLTGGLYNLQFDLLKDLEPIILIGAEPLLIVGKKSLPADDLKGLIAWLKANPDKASVGIAGVGATGHLTGISLAAGDRHQIRVRALSRQRAGDAGPAGRADRFHDRAGVELQIAARRRQRQAVRDHRQGAAEGLAEHPDDGRGRLAGLCRDTCGTGCGCRRRRQRTSSQSSTPPWCRCWRARRSSSASRNSASRFRRWTGNRRKRCARSRKQEAERWWPIIKASNIKVE